MKKLFRKAPCGHCEAYIDNGTRGIGCIGCRGTGEVYVEVDPADLELALLGVLDEFKKNLRAREKHWEGLPVSPANDAKRLECSSILESLETYESGLDLGEIREKLIDSEAWQKLKTATAINLGATSLTYNELFGMMVNLHDKAQAELEAEGKEKGDSHE